MPGSICTRPRPLVGCASRLIPLASYSTSARPPLFRLASARILPVQPTQEASSSTQPASELIDLCVEDAPQCWAIVGGEGRGEAVTQALRDVLLGRRKPLSRSNPYEALHPFLSFSSSTTTSSSSSKTHATRSPSEHILHLSFGARTASGGAFVDYSARYAAVREDEDAVTLYEAAMRSLGFNVGRVAKLACTPDALSSMHSEASAEQTKHRQAALKAHERILRTAPMLRLDRPPPASDVGSASATAGKASEQVALLHTPLIRLSNGQTRRARLLDALVRCAAVPGGSDNQDKTGAGALLVLSQPYNGLDAATRALLSTILQERHAARDPRILLILRAQDEVPEFVSHVVFINESGKVHAGEKQEVLQVMRRADQSAARHGSYERVKVLASEQHARTPSSGEALVSFTDVGVQYAGKMALEVSRRYTWQEQSAWLTPFVDACANDACCRTSASASIAVPGWS